MIYNEVPCKCGHTPENNRQEFETHQMRMGMIFGKELPTKSVLRCKTCKEVSIVRENVTDMTLECKNQNCRCKTRKNKGLNENKEINAKD